MNSDSSNTSSQSAFGKAISKFKEKPVFYTGAGALAAIVGGGLYGLKARKMRLSLYLINLRLTAQGSFVVILIGGVVYSLSKRYQSYHSINNDIAKK